MTGLSIHEKRKGRAAPVPVTRTVRATVGSKETTSSFDVGTSSIHGETKWCRAHTNSKHNGQRIARPGHDRTTPYIDYRYLVTD